MDLKDLKTALQELPQVETLQGQSNYIRWRREFLELIENEDLMSLIVPSVSAPTADNPNAMDTGETLYSHPGQIPSDTNADGTVKSNVQFQNEINIFKFKKQAYDEQQKRVRKARLLLNQSIDKSIRGQIVGMPLPIAWQHLHTSFGMAESMAQHILYRKMKSIELSNFDNAQEYISEHRNVLNDLSSVKATFSDAQLKAKLLDNLTDQYNGLITNIQYEEGLGQTLDLGQIVTRILTWESMLRNRKKTAGPNVKSSNKNNSKSTKNSNSSRDNSSDDTNRDRKSKCKKCNLPGHDIDACWFEHPELAPSSWEPKKKFNKKKNNNTNTASDDNSTNAVSLSPSDVQLFREFLQSNAQFKASGTKNPSIFPQPLANLAWQMASSLVVMAEEEKMGGGFVEVEDTGAAENEVVQEDGTTWYYALASGSFDPDTWLSDSGASLHVVNDDKWFSDLRPFSMTIGTPNKVGKPLSVSGGGSVRIFLLSKSGKRTEIILKNVAYCPDARCNLISSALLYEDSDIKSEHYDEGLFSLRGEEVGYAIRRNRLYHVQVEHHSLHDDAAFAGLVDLNNPVIEWHRKLGHIGMGTLLQMCSVVKGMEGISEKQIRAYLKWICPVCATTKALVRIPKEPSRREVTQQGVMIHVDTWGPYSVPSLDGTIFMLFFTDQATRYTWSERLKTKSGLEHTFKGLHRFLERAEGLTIRNYRFDGEFDSRAIRTWLQSKGVGVELTAPHQHYQNGIAEAANRRIRERTAPLLQEQAIMDKYSNIFVEKGIESLRVAALPEKLWVEAIERAVWIKNRTPSRALKKKDKKTPYEALRSIQPDVSRESIWGSRVYVTLPHERQGRKLHDARGWIGYFVGFETESMYLVYDPSCDKVVRVGIASIRVDHGQGLEDRQNSPSLRDRVGDQSLSDEQLEQIVPDADSDQDTNEEEPEPESSQNHDLVGFIGLTLSDIMADESEVSESPRKRRRLFAKDVGSDEDYEYESSNDSGENPEEILQDDPIDADREDDQVNTVTTTVKRRQKPRLKPVFDEQAAWASIGLENVEPTPLEEIIGRSPSDRVYKHGAKYNPRKCYRCFVHRRQCDSEYKGKGERCSTCVQHRHLCIPQTPGLQRALVDPKTIHLVSALPRKPHPSTIAANKKDTNTAASKAKERCVRCIYKNLHCNGETPCNNCTTKRLSRSCKTKEDTKVWELGHNCTTCVNKYCDRKRPCGTCTRMGKDCSYIDQNGAVTRRYLVNGAPHLANPPLIPEDPEDPDSNMVIDTTQCTGCRVKKGRECDHGEPCTRCIRHNSATTAFRVCTYWTEEGNTEAWSLDGWTLDEDGQAILKKDIVRPKARGNPGPRNQKKHIEDSIKPHRIPSKRPMPDSERDGDAKESLYRKFPSGWERVPTQSAGHQCGKFAISNSLLHQYPNFPRPTLQDLQEMAQITGVKDTSDFADDDLSRMLEAWGQKHSIRFQLGCVIKGVGSILVEPQLQYAPDFDKTTNVLWIHNDNAQMDNPEVLNHWEGIRAPSRKGRPPKSQKTIPQQAANNDSNPGHDSDSDGDDSIMRRRQNAQDDLIPSESIENDQVKDGTDDLNDQGYLSAASSGSNNSIFRRRMHRADDLVDDFLDFNPEAFSGIALPLEGGVSQGEILLPDPSKHEEYLQNPEPRNLQEALRGPEAIYYQNAADREIKALLDDHAFDLVDEPKDENIITSTMVLTRKIGADGLISKYKGRMCARGFQQVEGIDYTETYASTVRPTSVLILFAIAAVFGWTVRQMDVVTAFLNPKLQVPVYMRPPKGMTLPKGKVMKLNKTLYGLKQSAREWYMLVKDEMRKLGFRVSNHDPCVFIKDNLYTLMMIWVDDILTTGPDDKDVLAFQAQLSKRFKMTDEGLCSYYLGMSINQSPGSTVIHQRLYVQQILRRYGLEHAAPAPQPMSPTASFEKHDTPPDPILQHEYQSKIGSLIHLANRTRPDIAFSTGFLGRFSASPKQKHLNGATDILRYLINQPSLGIKFTSTGNALKDLQPTAYVDSDFAGCEITRKSTTGFLVEMAGGPISWSSKRQSLVTLSTLEAEYVAASEAAREAVWIRNFINDLRISDISIGPIPIYKVDKVPLSIDNNGALRLTRNPEMHSRSKHIDIKYHYVREQVENGIIDTRRVDTKDNLADMLTKPLNAQALKQIVGKAGLVEGEPQDGEEQGERAGRQGERTKG